MLRQKKGLIRQSTANVDYPNPYHFSCFHIFRWRNICFSFQVKIADLGVSNEFDGADALLTNTAGTPAFTGKWKT